MPGPNDPVRLRPSAEESFFDLLGETLESLERSVRAQFLVRFFKSLAHIDLTDGQSATAWERILARRRALSSSMSRPVSLKTAIMDVLGDMNLLHVPVIVEFSELRDLRVSAATDALTGLYNRRLFEEYFGKELSRAQRYSQQLALVILDLHRFKEVNDRYGHLRGDDALRLVAAAARETVRASDFAFRIGGDEFAVLLPRCDATQCTALSSRLRARYEAAVVDLHLDVPLTVDFGTAVFPDDGEQREVLIRLADRRLYDMKNAARPAVNEGTREPDRESGSDRAPVSSPSNKRKWERVPMAGTSAHIVWNEESPVTAPLIDVSFGGIALRAEDPVTFPASFQAMLYIPIQLPVKVCLRKSYEQRIDSAGTRVGCVFVN